MDEFLIDIELLVYTDVLVRFFFLSYTKKILSTATEGII